MSVLYTVERFDVNRLDEKAKAKERDVLLLIALYTFDDGSKQRGALELSAGASRYITHKSDHSGPADDDDLTNVFHSFFHWPQFGP